MSPILQSLANGSARGYGAFSGGAGFGPSFESIATVTASGGEITLSLTNIPQTYSSLQIRASIRNARALNTVGGITIYFNSDNAGSNYAQHRLRGNGSAVSASGSANQSSLTGFEWFSMPFASITSNTFGCSITDIHDYASTTRNKTIRTFSGCDTNDTTGVVALFSGLWANTSAMTSITFVLQITF